MLGRFLYVTTMTILTVILNGYAICFLWKWFIVTTFNLPIIGLPQSIGLGLVVGLLTAQYNSVPAEERDAQIVTMAVLPVLVTIFGWIITLFL